MLAAEVGGRDEAEPALREKARWYLARGVAVAWMLIPVERKLVVLTADAEDRYGVGDRVPAHHALPGLTPAVAALFRQVSLSAAR